MTAPVRRGNDGQKAERLRLYTDYRVEFGLTINQAADRVGITRRTADRYEAALIQAGARSAESTQVIIQPADDPAERRTDAQSRAFGSLAAHLISVASALTCAVRDEDRQTIDNFLAELGHQELLGLVVVLAGMVPLDQPVSDLLSWVTWDEYGQPLPAEQPRRNRLAVVPASPKENPANAA